jgi:hypothetical protein
MSSRRSCVFSGKRVSPPERGTPRHVVIRHDTGSAKLLDLRFGDRKEIEELIAGLDRFVAYDLIRTADGGASVSVFENETGTTESTRVAAAFAREHHPGVAVRPPEVIEGPAVMDFRETARRSSRRNRGRGLTSTAAANNAAIAGILDGPCVGRESRPSGFGQDVHLDLLACHVGAATRALFTLAEIPPPGVGSRRAP